jgi:hypothetical protein
MRVTIHQPDFMPWFGFFNKISKADTWIILDHVENNPRDAAFWGRRVQILVNGQPTWFSISLNRPAQSGIIGVPIRDMTINLSDRKTMKKRLKMVQEAYAKAPYFADHIPLVKSYFLDEDPSLMNRNLRFIEGVLETLNIKTKMVLSSSFDLHTKGTEMLVDLLAAVGTNTYLCGGGAQGYQQDDLFASHGIKLEYNRFEQPTYRQLKTADFVPGLSIIDALFLVPTDQLATWVKSA